MKFEGYNLTIYDRIAIQALILYHAEELGGIMTDECIHSDEGLRKRLVAAAEWYVNEYAKTLDDGSKAYGYIMEENKKYLKSVCSEAYLSALPEELKRFLADYYAGLGHG